jgi:hypothetical protein
MNNDFCIEEQNCNEDDAYAKALLYEQMMHNMCPSDQFPI